ncbi:penicillin-insensitive murein endopeptidase [Roseateles albus]|uniref:Penicillin-insensitive murein endopeptidase n=1 Tax=Roseateles albus TaxID=2987525 RepID=A0ABT5KGF1_9BURK|nr:penicillin-insensitive murein endopeptidase [Roseateles albus]MDC8772035.1 penicillin-insensitive murein endopeptidase [Roseateles albus]
MQIGTHIARALSHGLFLGLFLGLGPAMAQGQETAAELPAAKTLFGKVRSAAALPPQTIGFYSRGCVAGAQALPLDGPHWQAMRPSRQRMWGHPDLIRFVERFAPLAAQASGWPGILVGDIAQPRGGPMLTGHASHQLGLDVDIWLKPMPAQRMTSAQREQVSSITVVRADRLDVDRASWTPGHQAVLRAAAEDPKVQRIFINAAIKRALCRSAQGASWLRKIRPEHGHDYHFHVRLFCPEGDAQCKAQDPTPEGDGCDASLDWWFTDEALHPKPPAVKPAPLTMADLPADCQQVLEAR